MKTIMKYLVLLIAILAFGSMAFASSSSVMIDGDCLKFRDGSGNVLCLQAGSTITPGTVTYSSGSGTAVTTTGTETLTNKTLTSPTITGPTDAQAYVSNGVSMQGVGVTLTGNVTGTMANTGAIPAVIATGVVNTSMITNSSITATDLNYTVNLVNVAAGVPSTTETVTSGSVIVGFYPVANVTTEIVNSISISSTTLTMVLSKNAVVENVYKVVTLAP